MIDTSDAVSDILTKIPNYIYRYFKIPHLPKIGKICTKNKNKNSLSYKIFKTIIKDGWTHI